MNNNNEVTWVLGDFILTRGYGGLMIIEPTSKSMSTLIKLRRLYVYTRTKYQEIMLVEFEELGRGLVIDNYIQSTESDEHIYHESLVHPALLTHPLPRKVLIIGGGEGATLREVLKHNCVEKAIMVDIDGELVEFAKKYLDVMHRGSFNDPRAEVIIMDGKEYVAKQSDKSFDAVIIDLTDPYSSEIAKSLYSEEFYREIYRILKDDGIMVTQAGNSFFYNRVYEWVYNNVSKVFPITMEYEAWVPSFGYSCNFIIGSKKYDPSRLDADSIDKKISERSLKLRYYNGRVHVSYVYKPITKPLKK